MTLPMWLFIALSAFAAIGFGGMALMAFAYALNSIDARERDADRRPRRAERLRAVM